MFQQRTADQMSIEVVFRHVSAACGVCRFPCTVAFTKQKQADEFFFRAPQRSAALVLAYERCHLPVAQFARAKPQAHVPPHPVLVLGRKEFGPNAAVPTRKFWLQLILSFRSPHVRSMTCVPALH